jgi:protein tyrosine phosphatase (PTP) superfamily phosphohydrolase (DUF442 family)
MPWLKSEGFATVINLRLASEEGATVERSRAEATAIGMKYIHSPFTSIATRGPALQPCG